MGGPGSAGREGLSVDLLMVRDPGETSWEYVRRSVRREAQVRDRFKGETLQVIVGWGAGSVEEFLQSYPEYRSAGSTGGEAGETI